MNRNVRIMCPIKHKKIDKRLAYINYLHNFFFYLDGFLLFFFYFFALQNKICLIGSCSIFLLIILFVIVFLIVRQFSPDDSWSSSNWESSFQLLLYHSWWSVYFCYLVHFKCECFYLFFTLWIIMGRVFFTSAEE